MINHIDTPHGELRVPAFFPDATRGVARSLGGEDLAGCGIRGIMVNTFHLLTHPGASVIAKHGGIHSFMNWERPVSSDSGGFQVYSLLEQSPKSGSVSKKGFIYRSGKGGGKLVLTPEKSIQTQFRLQSDILFCLDYCTHPDFPPEKQELSVALTVAWARQCRETYDQLAESKRLAADQRPLLFGIVQGGENRELRKECAERLCEIGFDGYGFGGWPIKKDGRLSDAVEQVAEFTPNALPKFALGIGKPENVVQAFRLGYHIFDCVIPTRDARHKRLYIFNSPPGESRFHNADFYRNLYMQDQEHRCDKKPVDETCDCLCCRNYSRAYLYHLFQIRDALALRLASIHNVRFYQRMIEELSKSKEKESA
ncbi:MAG: tRNA guanosine(34) transglycosylase Tgt [Candidatus Omnitrophota bacterium]|jgi:queuine tRNA-ribosyltransferase|nr:MAG: tRNA guanosine(34) transglycosylase Tgt [Candidatus Omnitrophota bacterium]